MQNKFPLLHETLLVIRSGNDPLVYFQAAGPEPGLLGHGHAPGRGGPSADGAHGPHHPLLRRRPREAAAAAAGKGVEGVQKCVTVQLPKSVSYFIVSISIQILARGLQCFN